VLDDHELDRLVGKLDPAGGIHRVRAVARFGRTALRTEHRLTGRILETADVRDAAVLEISTTMHITQTAR
jgi:hypothetical protein